MNITRSEFRKLIDETIDTILDPIGLTEDQVGRLVDVAETACCCLVGNYGWGSPDPDVGCPAKLAGFNRVEHLTSLVAEAFDAAVARRLGDFPLVLYIDDRARA